MDFDAVAEALAARYTHERTRFFDNHTCDPNHLVVQADAKALADLFTGQPGFDAERFMATVTADATIPRGFAGL